MADGALADTRGDLPIATRLVSASAQDALERFSDPDLLAAGKVNVISLEAVQARFAARWGLRSDQVYDFTTRVLERGVGAQGFFLRVSDTDFFIVHPDLGRIAGQAACLRYLREVLNHFLGEDQAAVSGVLQVTRIDKGRIDAQGMNARAQNVDPSDLEAEDAARATRADAVVAVPSLDRWTPFVSNDGRHIRVSASLEPVYEMKGFTRIGFRMNRRVIVMNRNDEEELSPAQVAMLSTADVLRVDLATIARGVDRLRSESERQLSLIVPLSFTSLSSQKGRAEFVKQLKEAGALVKLGVICEICDIEGVPPSALLAAASLLRPFTVLVAGHLVRPSPAIIARLEGAGLQALSFDCPAGLGDAEFVGWANTLIAATKRIAKSVLIYRAGSPKRAGLLASLGASHVSIMAG
ncbi:hypothetical protein [Phenylobacterium sp.]|uniref:hypothetical protein n=1 Tax=Phenylobacterium sp. TaxID=1871053 RepID=UPI0025E234FD|nr:hypothetical protein [Phenylobacterium sp.]